MVVASLISFAILLVAWIAAPDRGVAEGSSDEAPQMNDPEAQPVAA